MREREKRGEIKKNKKEREMCIVKPPLCMEPHSSA